MESRHLQIGHQGEAIALKYLKKNGYKIIEQNYRSNWGRSISLPRIGEPLLLLK